MITDTRNGMRNIGKHNGNRKNYFTSSIILNNIVKRYGKENALQFLKKEIIVRGDFNDALLNELEKHYIRLYNTKKPYGYNLTDGGDGNVGYIFTDEVKLKMRANSPHRIPTTQEIEALRKRNIGNKYGLGKSKPTQYVRVAQYALDGEIIKIWDSIKEASDSLGIKHNKIVRVAMHQRPQVGGFVWKYVDKK